MSMEFENMVRCLNCKKEFHENEVIYDGDEDMEFCPYCGEGNTIKDMTIKNATFTSIWNGGYEVTTNCKVDMETREVFDIEVNDSDNIEKLNELNCEYITIDGEEFDVFSVDEVEDGNFWYE